MIRGSPLLSILIILLILFGLTVNHVLIGSDYQRSVCFAIGWFGCWLYFWVTGLYIRTTVK